MKKNPIKFNKFGSNKSNIRKSTVNFCWGKTLQNKSPLVPKQSSEGKRECSVGDKSGRNHNQQEQKNDEVLF